MDNILEVCLEVALLWLYFLAPVVGTQTRDGTAGKEERRAPRVDVRAVLVNCDNKETPWADPPLSAFEREELFRHNVLRDCRKKITLTLRLQADTNDECGDEYIWVENAFDGQAGSEVPLLNPYVVKLRQEPVLQAYNLSYLTTMKDYKEAESRLRGERDNRPARHVNRRTKRSPALDTTERTRATARESSSSNKVQKLKEEAATESAVKFRKSADNGMDSQTATLQQRKEKNHGSGEEFGEPLISEKIDDRLTKDTAENIEGENIDKSRVKRYFLKSEEADESNLTVTRLEQAKFSDYEGKSYEDYGDDDGIGVKTDDQQIDNASGENGDKERVEFADDDFEEENSRKYSVYVIGEPALWYSASVQLFEKQASPDGATVWSEVTGGIPVNVGSLEPEQLQPRQDDLADPESEEDSDGGPVVSLRYAAGDVLKKEHLIIPAPGKLLLLVPRPVNINEKYQSGAGEFLVAPANLLDLPIVKRDHSAWSAWSSDTPGGGHDNVRMQQRRQCERVLKASRPLRSVCSGPARGADAAHALVRRRGESYLAVRHSRVHRAQLDLEAKADDNEMLRLQTFARVTSVVVDGTRQQRAVITAQVGNTGLLSAILRVIVSDCPASMDEILSGAALPAPAVVPPRHSRRVQIALQGALPAEPAQCSLSVLNDKGEAVAIRSFIVKRNDRCFCVWHCACACIESSPQLRCEPLATEQLAAAGMTAEDSPRRARAVSRSDCQALDLLLMLVGLLLILFAAGLLKGLIGLGSPAISMWGLERLVELPRSLDEYYEPWLKNQTVVYDSDGWAVHPEYKTRTVRVMNYTTEFCLNTVFFLTFPCALAWSAVWLCVSRLCPCLAVRCQPPSSPVYAWAQFADDSGVKTKAPPVEVRETGLGRTPDVRCVYATDCSLDDTAEESDTNYVLTQMQKSKESLARTERKRANVSARSRPGR